jgi:polyhydroxyalkanoate synthesis regulator phasin
VLARLLRRLVTIVMSPTKGTTMNRRNRLWVGGAAALGAGALLAGPLHVAAQDDDTDDDTSDWVSEALDELVADGTITQQQADAVDDALDAARPERVHRHGPHWRAGGPFGGFFAFEAAADAIGIDEEALRDALRDGQTIAEVAAANGVDAQTVIDAMVAAAQERVDEAMANADERLADLEERITDLVNEGWPDRPGRPDKTDAKDDETSTTEPPATTTPPTTTAD